MKLRKILLTSVVAAFLLIGMMRITVNIGSAPGITINLEGSPFTAKPGGQITIYVYIRDVPDTPETAVRGYDWKLLYDASMLRYPSYPSAPIAPTDVQEGDFLSINGANVGSITTSGGAGFIGVTNQLATPYEPPAYGEGILTIVNLNVVRSGNCTLRFEFTKVFNMDLELVPHEHIDGTFYTDKPKADFEFTYPGKVLRPPIVGESITFNATYDPVSRTGSYDPNPGGAITNYHWDFGDGTSQIDTTDLTITHSYAAVGGYVVNLTVTDNSDPALYDSVQRTVSVNYYDLAVRNVKVDPVVATPGTTVITNVTVRNYGSIAVYLNLTTYYDDNLIWYNVTEGKSAFCLPLEKDPVQMKPPAPPVEPGQSLTVTFKWDTTGLAEKTYTIKANASILASAQLPDQFLEGVDANPGNNIRQTQAFITSSPINIAVTTITISPTAIAVGTGPVSIDVTIENQGNVDETFDTTFYYNSTLTHEAVLIGSQIGVQLSAYSEVTLTFSWDTTSVPRGIYQIFANVSEVPGDMVVDDNTLTYDGQVVITSPPIAAFTYTPDEPKVEDEVSFDPSNSQDPDGTIVEYEWNFGDGSPPESSKFPTHTYASAQTFTVTLTVTDNATVTNSTAKQIVISKMGSTIRIEVSSTQITFGQSVSVWGIITPLRFGASATIQSRLQGETAWTDITTKTTNQSSQFQTSWTPLAARAYELRALWLGDDNTLGASSPTKSVSVSKITSSISVDVSLETTKVNSQVVISGAILPARQSITVTISVSRQVGTWINYTTTTGSNGQYSYNWTPSAPGTYNVKASWAGDSNTIGSESITKTVNVEEEPSIPTNLILGGVVIAAVVVALLIYFLKIRKR